MSKKEKKEDSTNDSHIILTGVVTNVVNGIISVDVLVGENSLSITCHPGGKLRKNSIMIIKGDRVDVKVSPYDFSKGFVIFRHK